MKLVETTSRSGSPPFCRAAWSVSRIRSDEPYADPLTGEVVLLVCKMARRPFILAVAAVSGVPESAVGACARP